MPMEVINGFKKMLSKVRPHLSLSITKKTKKLFKSWLCFHFHRQSFPINYFAIFIFYFQLIISFSTLLWLSLQPLGWFIFYFFPSLFIFLLLSIICDLIFCFPWPSPPFFPLFPLFLTVISPLSSLMFPLLSQCAN